MSAVPLQRPRGGPPRPHLRVVTPPTRRHTVAFALLTVALGAISVFTTVAVNALAAGDAVRARALEEAVQRDERHYAELVAEVARLEDPARVEQVATTDLGMVPADGARFLVLDGVLTDDEEGEDAVEVGDRADPLKPVLSVER